MFIISYNSQFLLFTSVAPPTIYLTNLLVPTLPVLIRPYCSSSLVVAAAFHPDREDFFLLAFADGTAAVFDTLHFFRNHGKDDHRIIDAVSGSSGEIAFIKGLHATGTSGGTPNRNDVGTLDGYDPGTGIVGIGSKATGRTAVAFVPGRNATAVTVGANGKCCVVDFTQLTKQKAVLLRSWLVRLPATSLLIICSSQRPASRQLDGVDDAGPSKSLESNEAYDGRVLLFDLDGKPLGNQALDAGGSRIVDVEWTPIERRLHSAEYPRRMAGPTVPHLPIAVGKEKSPIKSTAARTRLQKNEVEPGPSDSPQVTMVDPLFDLSTPRKASGPNHAEDLGKQPTKDGRESDLISSSSTSSDGITIGNEAPLTSNHFPLTGFHIPIHKRRISESPEHVGSTKVHQTVADESTPPPIPPRPSPKPGGRLQKRRSQTANQNPTYLDVVSEARRISSNPRVIGVVFDPREPPIPKTQAFKTKTTTPTAPNSDKSPEEEWIDAPEPPHHTGLEPPQHRAPEPPPHRTKMSPPSSDSIKSYKTASSQLPSETSDDTVIDWSVGLTRQPVPSLQPSPQRNMSLSPKRPKQKGHISLSVSTTSREMSPHLSSTSDGNASPIAQSPTRSLKQPLPMLQRTYPSGEWTSKTVPKQKGHVSVPISPDTTDTITAISASSDDQIVQ